MALDSQDFVYARNIFINSYADLKDFRSQKPSLHDFGNLATVKYFMNPDRLNEFTQNISSDYFEALFEVTGIIRTDFDIELLFVNELYSNFKIKLE